MTVSLVKFDGSLDSIRKAIELCQGFEKLGRNDRVLIKPNNCFRHRIMPPYGMVTTSKVIDGVVQLLLEHDCKDISIGEGAIINIFDELEPYTKRGFKGTGIDRVAEKYGIKLIDFNQGPFHELDLGGIKVEVSSTLICLLNEAIKSDLVIIDGIYMLEKGPETLVGMAHRKDLIIASPDIFECDVVGAMILGIDPAQVDYLRAFAHRHSCSFDISAIQIKGEDIDSFKEQLEWRFEPDEELLTPAKVTGISAPHPGQTLCSACGATLAFALSVFGKDNPGMDFGGAALYYGLGLKPGRDTQKVFLYGDCAIRSNKSLPNVNNEEDIQSLQVFLIEGCPPTLTKTLLSLMKALLKKPRMLRMLSLRVIKLIGIRLAIYREIFLGWERYQSEEFDKTHF